MKSELAAKDLRRDLDGNLARWKKLDRAPPPRGWVHNVREAIGMSMHQLARILKTGQSTIASIEKMEAKGTIRLSTLGKAAAAMNCDLVYALVPREGTLEKLLERRRRMIARASLLAMMQKTNLTLAERSLLISEYAKKIKLNRVWEPADARELLKKLEAHYASLTDRPLPAPRAKTAVARPEFRAQPGDEFTAPPGSTLGEDWS